MPGPLESYRRVRSDIVGFLTELTRNGEPFVPFRVLVFPYALVNDPQLIREALVDQSETLIIKGGASKGLARLIGHGILTNRGDDWRKSRAALQPLFSTQALKGYFETMAALVEASVARWRAVRDATVPIQRELLSLSIRITFATLFQHVPSFEEADAAADAITVLQREGMERYLDGFDYVPFVPVEVNRRVDDAKATLRALAEKGKGQSVDEILSIVFAGTESPVNTLCFALKLLEANPAWKAKVAEQPSDSSWESTERLDVVAQVLSESLRLYPAGWAFERYASQACTLGEHRVPKGTRLLFSPYVLHRNPKIWREPERFDPTRFTTSPFAADGVPKYGYLPFGAGPRSCIGSRLAWAEMRLMLSALVGKFRWTLDGDFAAEGAFKIRLSRPAVLRIQQ